MSLQAALVTIKTADSALNTLIGTRFHPDALPQDVTLPCVTFQVISRIDADETFNSDPTFTLARVQMDGYAATSVLRSALRTALLNCFLMTEASGQNGTSMISGKRVQRIRKPRESESTEMLDTNTQAYRISIDFLVPYDE